MFRQAIECMPRGNCLPDDAHIVVSKYYIAFIAHGGEVKLTRAGAFVEVRALSTETSWFPMAPGLP